MYERSTSEADYWKKNKKQFGCKTGFNPLVVNWMEGVLNVILRNCWRLWGQNYWRCLAYITNGRSSYDILKGTYYVLFYFTFPLVSNIAIGHVNNLQSYKAHSPSHREFISPTENTWPNYFKGGPHFHRFQNVRDHKHQK